MGLDITTPWGAVINGALSIIDKIIPDPQAKLAAQQKVLELEQAGQLEELKASTALALGQVDIDKIEAQSESLFKSGWRPYIGWTCGGGLSYQFLFRPLLGWGAQNLWGWQLPPQLEMDTLMTLLFGMLGLGGYRTYEKVKGKN